MPISYKLVVRHYASRLQSLRYRIFLRGPQALRFNLCGLAVPYQALDILDNYHPALLSGRYMRAEIAKIWDIAKRAQIRSILLAIDEPGLIAVYIAKQIWPEGALTAAFNMPSHFVQARKLFKAFAIPCAARLSPPEDGHPGNASSRQLLYLPEGRCLEVLKRLPGDFLITAIKEDPAAWVQAGLLANRELALLLLPSGPMAPSARRAQLNRFAFALADTGMFVDARSSTPQMVVVRRWHRRIEPY